MLRWRFVYRRCANPSLRGRSDRAQEGEHCVVYAPVRDYGITTIDRWRTSEVTKTPSCLLDQDLEGRYVPRFYTRLEHDLGLATTHKRIGEIVTKPTLSSRRLHQTGQTFPVAILQHEVEAPMQQGRLGQIGDGRHGQTLTIRKSPQPLGSIEEVALGWRMHHANGDLPSLFQGDQRTKKWDAANKVLCPVDRVDNPPGVLAPWLGTKLFSQHAIIGEVLPQRVD